MMIYTDQLNRPIALTGLPERIISLVPSQTELLYYLGLDEEVAGITKFCVHPEHWFRNKTRVGGTKNVKIELVNALQPDLILANKEENTKEQMEELEKTAPVWISDVANKEDAFQMIQSVGEMTGKEEKAAALIRRLRADFRDLEVLTKQVLNKRYRTAYLIWKDPYMTVGGDTFISDIMASAGLDNVCGDMTRYPVITLAELNARNTELVLLSTEPYPFKQKHITELQGALPHTKILLADGEIFSWYGSRMLQVLPYARRLMDQILYEKS